jgi:hypothetical protein
LSPREGATTEETNAPRTLLIPLVLFKKIRAIGRPLMPHKVSKLVVTHLEKVTNDVVADAWSLISNGVSWRRNGILMVIAGMHFLSKLSQRGKKRI